MEEDDIDDGFVFVFGLVVMVFGPVVDGLKVGVGEVIFRLGEERERGRPKL